MTDVNKLNLKVEQMIKEIKDKENIVLNLIYTLGVEEKELFKLRRELAQVVAHE